MDAYLGTVQSFAFSYAPQGWQICRGQIMSIQQSSALFTLLGMTYGGDGRTTFGLPNLSGRTVVGTGQMQGGNLYNIGQIAGQEQTTLSAQQMPTHSHGLMVSNHAADASTPTSALMLGAANGFQTGGDAVTVQIYAPASSDTALAAPSIGPAGGSQPLSLMQPYLALTYCICISGNYPSRN